MKVFVVVKRTAFEVATLECLGVFNKVEDARKAMKDDFESQEYDEKDWDTYEVGDDEIYLADGYGFSDAHYWSTIMEQEVK
jgi:hypothetical protein